MDQQQRNNDKWLETKAERAEKMDQLELRYGYEKAGDEDRVGWLLNFSSTSVSRDNKDYSAVKCFFIAEDNTNFKALVFFSPYFYVYARNARSLPEISNLLQKQFRDQVEKIEVIGKEDLDLKNHLSGKARYVLKISCCNVQDLMEVRNFVKPYASRESASRSFQEQGPSSGVDKAVLNEIESIREYDVRYHERFAIDTNTRCGLWYDVTTTTQGGSTLKKREDLIRWAQPIVCAFDIETTKLPLRFPSAEYDQVFMISYMINGKGFLIVNREVVGSDIDDFEYVPKKDIGGSFEIFNEPDELALLWYFINHMKSIKPHIYVTYNGDFFDWPFMEKRCGIHGINLYDELGFYTNTRTGECRSHFAIHMDAFYWVKRDSYLPQGSQGLKAVTKAKLGYNPVEVDPEDMVKFAYEHPQRMASYSVSDAVATYFLYDKYVHPFIFSLGTIIPMPPDDVLRKGSGTLCESLLMVQAYDANIIAPNKFQSQDEKWHNNRLLESETYIGGHVEALESGVFRADIPIQFNNDSTGYQELIDQIDADLQYTIVVENKLKMEDVKNYDEIRDQIVSKLAFLRDNPRCMEKPLIYHLDVAAMYPNIILTNRLQPCSTVTDEDCAACDFNTPDKKCLREMEWTWRGETYAGTSSEYHLIKNQAETESFPSAARGGKMTSFLNLKKDEKIAVLKGRFKKYCQKVYGRTLNKPVAEPRIAGICMRENNFYVNTVQSFRDRRYEYKALNKKWKSKLGEAEKSGVIQNVKEAQDMVILYDSLQLAHKCILNSFYGYVMRKGARWYSMEMAGVVTLTGALIIQNACKLIERVGRPLELDTDGIWCCLPGSFPEEYKLETNGKPVLLSYPGLILNAMVAKNNENDQYQSLVDAKNKKYEISSRMTIEFEVDGPYKAMILPAALAEGKGIKKRYAVFDFKGRLVELKGFELKRRGELKLVKLFQEEIFGRFLDGGTLEECYSSVASVANRWLDVLDTRGIDLTEEELLELIADSKTMSKTLAEYGDKRSCAITTATRLNAFLGGDTLKYGSLNCTYVIAKKPEGLPVSERTIPVTIFKADSNVRKQYLSLWCKDPFHNQDTISVRDILDWDYYKDRLGKAIQKIITIPAAMQKVSNPVPRVRHPDWLHKTLMRRNDKFKQHTLTAFTTKAPSSAPVSDRRKPLFVIGNQGKDNEINKVVEEKESHGDEANMDVEESPQKGDSPVSVLKQGIEDRHMTKDEYVNWLKTRKAYWKQLLIRRKLERNASTDSDVVGSKRARNVGEFFRRQQSAAIGSFWHIIHLSPTENPRILQAWFYIQGTGMYSIPLRIPRKVFLHPSEPIQPKIVSQFSLPHCQCENSIEVLFGDGTESVESATDFAIATGKNSSSSVYGTKISAIDAATLTIGCVAYVEPQVQKQFKEDRKLADGVSLDELRRTTTAQCPYVYGDSDIGNLYLYSSQTDSRGLLAITFTQINETFVVIINPFTSRAREVSTTNLDRMYTQVADPESQMSFRIEYARSVEDAGNAINRELLNFKNSYRGALVSVYEGHLHTNDLVQLVPALKVLPQLRRAQAGDHNEYPLMQWQTFASERLTSRIATLQRWIAEQAEAAQYSHIPVGNIRENVHIHIADVLFARSLKLSDQLPWWGSYGQTDVGGFEGDLHLSKEETPQFEIKNAGFYPGVVVQFKIYHLALSAILKMLDQSETISMDTDNDAGNSLLLKNTLTCSPAVLRVLKSLCQRWYSDVTHNANTFADQLLINFYRWISDKNSSMYDPALHQKVRLVVNSSVSSLVQSIEKQNIKVIHANKDNLVVFTGKKDIDSATAFVQTFKQIIGRNDNFSFLQLEEEKWFKQFTFYDQFNYAGLQLEESSGESEGFQNSPRVYIKFDMSNYLPKVLYDAFQGIISEYTLKFSGNVEQYIAPTQEMWMEDEDKKVDGKVSRYITDELSDKLLRIMRDADQQLGESDDSPTQDNLPRSGKHGQANVLLTFVRILCSVLSLNSQVKDEVGILRKNLLRAIQCNEYGTTTGSELPNYSLVVQDMILPHWNTSRDLDLLRDSFLLRYLNQHPEDKSQIEMQILKTLNEMIDQYYLQDLRCKRTNQVHSRRLCNHSAYGGSLLLSKSAESFRSLLEDFQSVADFYNFSLMANQLSWLRSLHA
jgi:DNA polymerase epsilon subunit 1